MASLLLAMAVAIAAGPADAIQFTLPGGALLNTFASGNPGTPFGTGPGGVDYDGIGSGDPHPGELLLNGQIPFLNYTDGVSQFSQGFGTPLDFSLEAQLLGFSVTTSGPNTTVLVLYEGTADGLPDLVLTDPTDSTILLEANLVAGTFGVTPVDPLTATVTFTGAPPAQPVGQGFAFFQVLSNGRPYESLFDSGIGGLNDPGITAALLSNFVPDFDVWLASSVANSTPASVDAEANGTVFKLTSSQFQLPEPSVAVLLGLVALGLAARRRRRG